MSSVSAERAVPVSSCNVPDVIPTSPRDVTVPASVAVPLTARVADAVAYSLDCHRNVARLGEELDLRLEAQIGIHFGEVWQRKNRERHRRRGARRLEIVGRSTVLAARLAALAQGRQTLLTHAAFELARGRERGPQRRMRTPSRDPGGRQGPLGLPRLGLGGIGCGLARPLLRSPDGRS